MLSHALRTWSIKTLRIGLALCWLCLPMPRQPATLSTLAPSCPATNQQDCFYTTCCLEVSPATPVVTDTLRITASGIWPDSCGPKAATIYRRDRLILVTLHQPPAIFGCLFVLTSWSQTVETGVPDGGVYYVSAYLTRVGGYWRQPCGSATISVTGEGATLFLPVLFR